MDKSLMGKILAALDANAVVHELQALVREAAGADLRYFMHSGSHVLELYPKGRAQHLSDFCRLVRKSRKGRRNCETCRCLVSLGARYRGLNTYRCHGGLAIVAAPAANTAAASDGCIVAVGSAFAVEDSARGWQATKRSLRRWGADISGLQKAYRDLPVLTAERGRLMGHLVKAAAAEADAIYVRLSGAPRRPMPIPVVRHPAPYEMADVIGKALLASRSREHRAPGETAGHPLAVLIKAMVAHDPSLPYTVGSIACAANLTPNYFSSLFKRQTGATFIEFLTAQRITCARRLLFDCRLNIAEVADRAGFSDEAYFCRRFKASVGMSPREWRDGGQADRSES